MIKEYISEEAWEEAAIDAASFPILVSKGQHWRTYEMTPTVFRNDALEIQKKMDLEAQKKML